VPKISGNYAIHLSVSEQGGDTKSCSFVVTVGSRGLRVELWWDQMGNADLDLHGHRPGTISPWFSTSGTTLNRDDCFYDDCSATATNRAAWGLANSSLADCADGPDGVSWSQLGFCSNPRIDADNSSTPAEAEGFEVDDPSDGASFRALVHYFGGTVAVHPVVSVSCAGQIVALYGTAQAQVPGLTAGGGFGAGPMWRVADITTHVGSVGVTTCSAQPIHPPGSVSGYYVTQNDKSF
jgi:hypothetical protein